jgi:spermidine/putrescine transport system permease protein
MPAESRGRNRAVTLLAMGSLALLYVPLAAVAVFSVNNSRHGVVWKGFTLRWYESLFHDPKMLELTINTLILAGVSTVIATLIGTAMALGIARYPWPRWARVPIEGTLQIPVVTPDILFAVGLVVAFGLLRSVWSVFDPGLFTMILGHVSFQIAFVALVVRSRLTAIGPQMEEAARDLYSEGWGLFRRVTLPLILPGVVAGAMLAFTLSLDDFVISFFTAGPTSTTLPIYIYATVRRGLSPQIHALSTLMMLVTVLLVLGVERLSRHRKD